jgi:hypothetical protein
VIRHKNSVLDEWCTKVGRDPSAIERSAGCDPAKLDQLGDALIEAGANLITLGVGGPDYDLGFLDEWVAWRDQHNA